MSLFHLIEDGHAVLCSNGVYRQVPLYRREGYVYAKWGAGFIGLRSRDGTTLPHVRVEYVEGPVIEFDRLGRAAILGSLLERSAA